MAEIRHPNLSTKDGTFAQVFEENKVEFTKLSDDSDVTYSELKDYILELLDGCKPTPWVKKI